MSVLWGLGFFALSYVFTGMYRRYALKHDILDIPNQRSAHADPIPRGAGAVFVLLFVLASLFLAPAKMTIEICALILAVLGFWDDKHSISPLLRLISHFMLAIAALNAIGGMPNLQFFSWTWHANFFSQCLGVIFIVWMINSYNFMDGINGLAAGQAVSVLLAMMAIYLLSGGYSVQLFVVLAAVVGGFLIWNFPLAKVFMGDVGSCFLGFMFGIWTLEAGHLKPELLWSWLIMLGVFLIDSSLTLMIRLFRGQPIHQAHASHAYQYAARRYKAHWRVTLPIILLNVLWLFPWALLVSLGKLSGYLGLMIAYFPLLILAIYLKTSNYLRFS